jgi:hypothetical protein
MILVEASADRFAVDVQSFQAKLALQILPCRSADPWQTPPRDAFVGRRSERERQLQAVRVQARVVASILHCAGGSGLNIDVKVAL